MSRWLHVNVMERKKMNPTQPHSSWCWRQLNSESRDRIGPARMDAGSRGEDGRRSLAVGRHHSLGGVSLWVDLIHY